MNKLEIYQNAVALYGEKAQFNSFTEELLELLLSMQHFIKGKTSREHVIEEMVDVSIMLEQMKIILGASKEWSHVESEKLQKLQRHIQQSTFTVADHDQ